jgi:hypothetical protein
MGAWARRILPALAAIGLPKLASAPPHELLHLIPHPLPSVNSDPGTWWRGLTSRQGIGAEGAEALRVVIENAGPSGTEQVLAAYQEALRVPLDRLKAERESLFTRVFRHAERVAGSTAFDPRRLPGGDPFALFSLQLPHAAWRVVEEGIRAGQGLEAFRAFENAREQHVLAAAAAELPAMLAALWEKRGAASAGNDAADPDADAAGWWSRRRQRWHDQEALLALCTEPEARQILLAGGAVDGTTLAGLRAHGEVAGPDEAGAPPNDPKDPNDWATLAFLEKHCPGAAPIVAYFRSRGPDAEELWRGYCNTLAPHFERIGFPDDDAVLAPRELASAGIYLAVSPASGPSGWRRAIDAELSPFDQDKIRRVGAVLSFWVEPVHGIKHSGEAGDPMGDVFANIFTAGLWGATRFAARGPALARAAAERAGWWDHRGEQRHQRWADHEALEAFRHNPRLHRLLERGGSVDGMTLRGLRGRGDVSGPEEAGEAGWIRLHRRVRPLFHLTFGRPMGRRELARLLALVPQLRAHPDGVIREMAGLVGQARSVLGVDARTGEYLAEAGDTLPFIAEKLVGDAGRWRELEAANPAREEGDPRIRIPCNWFGFVPYAIPVEQLAAEMERRREEAGAIDEAGVFDGASAPDDAGAPRRRVHGGRRAGHRLPGHGSDWATFGSGTTIGGDPDGGGGDDGGDDADAGAWGGRPLSMRERRKAERLGLDRVTQHPGHLLRLLRDAERREGGEAGDVEGIGDWLAQHNPFASPPPPAPPAAPPPPPPPEEAPEIDLDKPAPPSRPRAVMDGPRQPITKHTYVVKAGDWPERIADRLGGRRPHRLAELFHANPHKHITARNWDRLVQGEVINLPDAWETVAEASGLDSDAGALDTSGGDDAGDALRQNLTKRTYSVVRGDSMFSIAKKLGAAPSRPTWFPELRDVNTHKSMEIDPATHKQIKWTTLNPGEIINIPDEWPDAPQLRPPPGGVATAAPLPGLKQFPELPGGATPTVVAPARTVPAGATVDPGTILRVQGILIAWRHAHPDAASPRDFGAGSPVSLDALGVLNARTQEALASFQRWSNKTAGTHLRTDGVLDPETIAALDSWSVQAVAQLPQRPAPVPVPGADPPHPADPFASILGAVAGMAANVAQRIRVPVSPSPNGPAGSAPPEAAPPAAPVDQDPFAGVPGVEGNLGRTPGPEARAPREARPSRPGNAPPALPPAPPPLAQLPDLLQRAGAPGVPGLPGGAPHAPAAGPLQVPPEVYRRLRDQAPPEAAPSPPPARKSNDDAVAAAGLGILAALGGLI